MLVTVPVADREDEMSTADQWLQIARFRAEGYSSEHVKLQASPGCLIFKFQRAPMRRSWSA
eukprot:1185243-Prorocentrum_minimum.AAC.3